MRKFTALAVCLFLTVALALPCLGAETDYAALFQAALNSDGAQTEALEEQLGQAFRADPAGVLTALSDTDGETRELVLSLIAYNGGTDPAYLAALEGLAEADLPEEAGALADWLRAQLPAAGTTEPETAPETAPETVPETAPVTQPDAQPENRTGTYIALAFAVGAFLLAGFICLRFWEGAGRKPLAAFCFLLAVLAAAVGWYTLTHPETVAPPTEPQVLESTPAASTEPVPETTAPAPTLPLPTEETAPMPDLPEPEDTDFVRLADFLPQIRQDLRYATAENFTGTVIYKFHDAWLRYGTVKKLAAVQAELENRDMGLVLWDGYRPTSAQFALWAAMPDGRYVSDPTKGFSSHSRGGTVDVSVADREGTLVPMPTDFDDFTPLADRDYSDCQDIPRQNAQLLEAIMSEAGFTPYSGEWWHFQDADGYPVEENFLPSPTGLWTAECEQYITLRAQPDTGAEDLAHVPAGAEVALLRWRGDFALAVWEGQAGWLRTDFLTPKA